jgi:hypothetical protein
VTTPEGGNSPWSSLVTSQKYQDITSNKATTASFHILSNSLLIIIIIIIIIIIQLFEAILKLLTALVYKLQNIRTKGCKLTY